MATCVVLAQTAPASAFGHKKLLQELQKPAPAPTPAAQPAAMPKPVAQPAKAKRPPPKRSITNIAGDVYQFKNNFHNSVFMVTPGGIIFVDPINK